METVRNELARGLSFTDAQVVYYKALASAGGAHALLVCRDMRLRYRNTLHRDTRLLPTSYPRQLFSPDT